MTFSNILEVAIGLALIYYLLGFAVSTIVNLVKTIFDLKAQTLTGVLALYLEGNFKSGNSVFDRFMNHPMITALKPIEPNWGQLVNRHDRQPDKIPESNFSLALLEMLQPEDPKFLINHTQGLISRVAAQADPETANSLNLLLNVTFEDDDALLDALYKVLAKTPEGNVKHELLQLIKFMQNSPEAQLEMLRAGIHNVDNDTLNRTLHTLLDLNITSIDQARTRIEGWFDDIMVQVSRQFTKYVRLVVIITSLIITLAAGPDTVQLVEYLLDQPTQRAALQAAVPGLLTEFGPGQISAAPKEDMTAEELVAEVESGLIELAAIVDKLSALDVPLPWWRQPFPTETNGIIVRVIGILITWVAAAQGSSFWYDLLRRMSGK